MGCAVNGPGEAGDADFGIAGGRDAGHIYAHGAVLRRSPRAVWSTSCSARSTAGSPTGCRARSAAAASSTCQS